MKKILCVFLLFTMAIYAFAQKVTASGRPPTVSGGSDAAAFNSDIKTAFDKAIADINKNLSTFASPDMLLESMGNSSVYASHGATTRAYGGYKIFSATIGLMVGLQLPSGLSTIMKDVESLDKSMTDKGDIKLGINPNFFNAHVGINMGIFKLENLYLGLRIGYFNLPDGLLEGFDYNSFTLGVTANYQIIPSISLAGLVTWRGVSLGSGIIYSGSKIGFAIPLGNINEDIDGSSFLRMNPEAFLNMDVTTVIVPLEAITSIKLLIFNIPFGLGADLSFGSSSLGFGLESNISLDLDSSSGYQQGTAGDISVKGNASNSPSFFNFKIMTGFGFVAGPVIFDFPITFYPAGGYNFGLTIGAVF